MTQSKLLSFSSISLSEPIVTDRSAKADIFLKSQEGKEFSFTLQMTYEYPLGISDLPLLRMAYIMPILNYGLFSKRLEICFPISDADSQLIHQLNTIFSRDIFVNKILRRRTNYILPEFIPEQESVKVTDANPQAGIVAANIYKDTILSSTADSKKCGILSSGGKESLLTYGLLKELGAGVYPLYVNESGGHWRTALAAYKEHKKTDDNTSRVWTNVDRFYSFMLDHLPFIRKDHRKIRADTYPVQLCIFPYYVFALLPVFVRHKIGNLLIGSEFDDLRDKPTYQGIPHYFGIYDQHQDFDILMNDWYKKRLPSMIQWSALRSISGLIVERILTTRYPNLAQLQRSCHSCHVKNGAVIPCGSCTKCLGVLLFLFANHINPTIMNFQDKDIALFPERIKTTQLRLDEDEKNQSLHLAGLTLKKSANTQINHIEQIHIDNNLSDPLLIPDLFRSQLFAILEKYTKGYCTLKDGRWIPISKKIVL